MADDIPVSNLYGEARARLRWRDGLFVQEFDSEITLCRKVLKAQAKFHGWEAGSLTVSFAPLAPGIIEAQACPYGRALDSCATLLGSIQKIKG